MYKVQSSKFFPIPKTIRKPSDSQRKYPFADLKVGQMFFIPGRDKNTLSAHMSASAAKLKIKLRSKVGYGKKDKRGVWIGVPEGTKGAKIGLGVWRVK